MSCFCTMSCFWTLSSSGSDPGSVLYDTAASGAASSFTAAVFRKHCSMPRPARIENSMYSKTNPGISSVNIPKHPANITRAVPSTHTEMRSLCLSRQKPKIPKAMNPSKTVLSARLPWEEAVNGTWNPAGSYSFSHAFITPWKDFPLKSASTKMHARIPSTIPARQRSTAAIFFPLPEALSLWQKIMPRAGTNSSAPEISV